MSGGGRPLAEALLRALLGAQPRAFRDRFGAELEREVIDCLRSGRRSAVFLVVDALVTLVRVWSGVAAGVVRSWAGALAPGRGAQDVRYALRALRLRPLNASVVVATLAVAIGANTAVFTVAHGLLLRTLPYDDPDRIVRIRPVAVPGVLEHPAIELHAEYSDDGGANLVEGEDASRIRLAQVSADFIRVMGVTPLLGRSWGGDDGPGEALLSHGLWTRAFGADPGVVGRTLHLNGLPFRIAGVLPPGVDFPVGAEAWVSLPLVWEFYGGAVANEIVTRVHPGVSLAELERELQSRARASMAAEVEALREAGRELPETHWLPEVVPLMGDLTASVRLPLLVLGGAALLVLLLGCANVAGVSLARLSAREQELAVRGALGASRVQVFRQLLVEAAVPAVLAGVASLLVARGGFRVLRAFLPPETPNLAGLEPGAELAWATGAATVAAGLLAGLFPALHGAGRLRRIRAGTTSTDEPRRQRLLAGLAITQIALALVLVTGAVLMARSLARLRDVPLGFDVEGVLTFEVRLPSSRYTDEAGWRVYQEQAEEALRAIPAVARVGATSRLPLADGLGFGFAVRPEGAPATDLVSASFIATSPDYFEAIGTRVLEGSSLDGVAGEKRVMLSRALASSLFPDGSAVGRSIRIVRGPRDEGLQARVTGVVEDVRRRGPDADAGLVVYESLADSPRPYLGFGIRYRGDGREVVSAVREALRRVDPSVPPFAVRTTGEAVSEALAARRSVALVTSLFGAAALLLAALGVYGLVSHAVARRRRELGVRMALGAGAGQVTRMVLARGLGIAGAGVALGVVGSLAATRILEGLLYEVSATDPATFSVVPVVAVAAALLACWIPARRAGRMDPVASLRAE